MKTPLILGALSLLTLLVLPSCVDPNYYGGSAYYGSSSYSTMPYGYSTVYVSGAPYYYYGNSWYRRSHGRYIRCARPHGYRGTIGRAHHYGRTVSRLPYGYRSVNVGSRRYYNHGNSWYRKSGSGYVATTRPSGYNRYSSHYKRNNTPLIGPGSRSGSRYQYVPSRSKRSYNPVPTYRRSNKSYNTSPTYRRNSNYQPTGQRSHYTKKKSSGSPMIFNGQSPRRTVNPSVRSGRSHSVPQVRPPKASNSNHKKKGKSHPLSKPINFH